MRQALQHGIDRDEIISTVCTKDWLTPESLFQSNVPGATDHKADFAYDPCSTRTPNWRRMCLATTAL